MTSTGSFLVVEDDPRTARTLQRLLARYREVEVAHTAQGARDALASGLVRTGLVVDVGLPDGSGLDVVRFARQQWPVLPVLVLTGCHDPPVINRSHQLRAEFVCKPARNDDVLAFARRAIAFERVPEERLSTLVAEVSRQSHFTPRETEVVLVALSTERSSLTAELGVSENTLKSLVRSVLGKTGHDSLASLTKQLLRSALDGTVSIAPQSDVDASTER